MRSNRLAIPVLGIFLLGSMAMLSAAPTKEEEEVAKHIKTLKSAKDAKDRVFALKELGRLGQIQVTLVRPVMSDMIRALEDKDPKVRAEAAHAIGKCDPENKKDVVEKLVKLLKDEKDETVRRGVAQGLAAMGPDSKDAVPALREALQKAGKKDGQVYQTAIMAITGKKK